MTDPKDIAAWKRLRDTLDEAIAKAEAGSDVTIEYRYPTSGLGWRLWGCPEPDYRVAVKPREAFAVTWPNGSYYSIHDTRAGAERLVKERGDSCFEIIRLVEEP